MGWLKFFGLGFFSDKLAKEGARRNFLNFVLSFALAIAFIFCGLLASNVLPFSFHYKRASQFREVFAELCDSANLVLENGILSADKRVNTFTETPSTTTNGYNVILDVRPITALDDFDAYCLDGNGNRTEYSDWLKYSDEVKENYKFCLDYTDRELVLDGDKAAVYEAFLNSSSGEIAAEYESLQAQNLPEQDYWRGLYELYVRAYYPDLSSYETDGAAPRLRTYYYRTYLGDATLTDYLILFDNMIAGSFETDSGNRETFYGFFDGISVGKLNSDNIDAVVRDAFGNSLGVNVTVFLNNIFRFLPVLLLIPLFCALICWIAFRAAKARKPYVDCLKIVGAFNVWSALLAAFGLFVCAYFTSLYVVNILPIPLFFAVILLRTVIFTATECKRIAADRRAKQRASANKDGVSDDALSDGTNE